MLLKILLFVLLDGYCISCSQTERFLPSRINERKLISDEESSANNAKTFLSALESFNADCATCDSTNEKKHVLNIVPKHSIFQPYKKKHGRHKRFKLNGINLSGLIEQGYEFDESPPVKRDLYLYKEIFCPWEYNQLQGNYFNTPFFENRYGDENDGDHVRKKRFPLNLYDGNPESQFTSDLIEEYINLKTGERTKQKISNLEKAFQRLEQDITELAKLKSITGMNFKTRNKLSLNPEKDNIEVNMRMPSNIEHTDREILEEVVRIYVPKVSKSTSQGPLKISSKVFQEQSKPSFQSSFKNNIMKSGDKKVVFSPIGNPTSSFNIKLNKTNQNGEYK
ncbi:uncharacterized protein [Halyomorpha halys]|uniref:uncharacterized protein n=1 Tax=Halyomorpha halys TaxID=286706 RepID=UPI0006D4DAA7|nr:uncharacterized protein LOC106679300 [Halyomorpha halys]